MSGTALPEIDEDLAIEFALDKPWSVVVWDDPVNLQTYVVRVFRTHFGLSLDVATKHMMQVHNNGSSVLASGPRETMEMHAHAMHDYGLQATVQRASA